MATEVEIKAKERKEILDEIKRKRAAVAQSEGILGAAERGEYGDVGQGGEKGPFDDEINQDLNKFSVSDIPELVPLLDTVSPTDLSSKGINALMRRRFPALIAADLISSNIPAPIKKNIATKANEIYSGIFNKAREALGLAPQYVMNVDGTLGYTGAKPFQLLKMSDEGGSNVIKSSDEVIVPRQIKVISGAEPDLTKLIIKKNGKDFVNIGSATNNRLIELDKVKLVKKQLSESDRNPRDQYFFQLKSKDDDLRLTKDEPGTFVTVSNRKIPIEDTTRIDLDVPYGNRQTFYRVINEDKKLIRERNDNDAKFIKYYQNNLTDKKRSLADIGGDSEFRFFNNIRRTEPDLEAAPNAFFSQYNKKRIQPGGDLHEKYLQFEKIDQIRKTNIEELRPVLIKILSNLTGKDSKAHFQIAHKYMASGIKKGFVDKSKKGTGADAAELYIDISDYNAGIQKTLEANARMIIKQGLADGKSLDEIKNMRDFKLLDLDMKNLGIQGEANGLTIGKAIPIDEKIGNLIIRGLNKGIISDAESKIAEEAVDRILNVKKEFEIIFQQPAPFAKGGLVGINYLTRPLGNF